MKLFGSQFLIHGLMLKGTYSIFCQTLCHGTQSGRPWMLYSAVVNYIKQEWNYKNVPLIVVLDSQGMVRKSNAMDMVFIFGFLLGFLYYHS